MNDGIPNLKQAEAMAKKAAAEAEMLTIVIKLNKRTGDFQVSAPLKEVGYIFYMMALANRTLVDQAIRQQSPKSIVT